jgi:hypothetical protein
MCERAVREVEPSTLRETTTKLPILGLQLAAKRASAGLYLRRIYGLLVWAVGCGSKLKSLKAKVKENKRLTNLSTKATAFSINNGDRTWNCYAVVQ